MGYDKSARAEYDVIDQQLEALLKSGTGGKIVRIGIQLIVDRLQSFGRAIHVSGLRLPESSVQRHDLIVGRVDCGFERLDLFAEAAAAA